MSEQRVFFDGGRATVAKVVLLGGGEMFVMLREIKAIYIDRVARLEAPQIQVEMIVGGQEIVAVMQPEDYHALVAAWLEANAENMPRGAE